MRIKSLESIIAKWRQRASVSTGAYEEGVKNPRTSWARAAMAAFDNYKAGVQAAITAGSYKKGIHRAGDAKWQERAVTLGVRRWPEGIEASGPAYSQGFSPYHKALANLTLPPRYARGDPRNLERVKKIAELLHSVKVGMPAS